MAQPPLAARVSRRGASEGRPALHAPHRSGYRLQVASPLTREDHHGSHTPSRQRHPPSTRTSRRPGPARPATSARPAFTIADPGPLGLAAFALTTFVLSMFNAGPRQQSRASRSCSASRSPTAGSRSCWPACGSSAPATRSAPSRSRRYGAFWISFFVLVDVLREPVPAADAGARGRALPDRLGHLHRVHVGRLAAHDGRGRAGVPAAGGRRSSCSASATRAATTRSSRSAAGSASRRRSAAWYASFAAVTNATFGRTLMPVVPLDPQSE